jgi:RHS repeat-associated protein
MYDGQGSVMYSYNSLAQLTSETRTLGGPSFTLSYGYNLAGELNSITNPFGAQVGYGYDKVGRLTNVSGSGYAGVSNYASSITYRAFGALKGMTFRNGRTLATAYDGRMRPITWDVAGVLGYNYNYDYFNEHTGRVTYAGNRYDSSLDRSYEYDDVGRLAISHTGAEARAAAWTGLWGTMDGPYSQGYQYDVWGNVTHKYGWGGEVQGGSTGVSTDIWYSYTGNRRNGFTYDAAGNLTNDLGQNFAYDVTGQQTSASYGGYSLSQEYDGNGLRVKKTENGTATYYLRSTVLGGQVVAEINSSGGWQRGYVYTGGSLLAVQQAGVNWVHEDPVTKSKRLTNDQGIVVSTIELDPWGADTNRSGNAAFQPHKYTTYERDGNGSDEAMFRRYNRWHSRFDQPDPYDGSYNMGDPQSFNRYAYVNNDPVNFTDPTGLQPDICTEFDEHGACVIYSGYTPAENSLRAWARYANSRSLLPGGGTGGNPHGGGGGPQNPAPTQKPNPNCITNAVSGATGLARPFGNVGADGSIGHDGIHVVAPPGSTVTTLGVLAGTVLGIHNQGDGLRAVDVLVPGVGVAIYKDLGSVNVRAGQKLSGGTTIGAVGVGGDYAGLHFALLSGGRAEDSYYRSLTSRAAGGDLNAQHQIKASMFINPNGPNSPVNCPGVPVNNAGVNPHP